MRARRVKLPSVSRDKVVLKQAFPRSHHRASARGIAIVQMQEAGRMNDGRS